MPAGVPGHIPPPKSASHIVVAWVHTREMSFSVMEADFPQYLFEMLSPARNLPGALSVGYSGTSRTTLDAMPKASLKFFAAIFEPESKATITSLPKILGSWRLPARISLTL